MDFYRKVDNIAYGSTPSTLLLVSSPLQILCAYEFINAYHITDYQLIISIGESSNRLQQIQDMSDNLGLQYEVIYQTPNFVEDFLDSRGLFLQKKEKTFDRIVIGGHFDLENRSLAGRYAHKGTVVVYMDDGIATIAHLKNIYWLGRPLDVRKWSTWFKEEYCPYRNREVQIERRWDELGIVDNNYVYTLFKEVPTKRCITKYNTFEALRSFMDIKAPKKGVYILGTIMDLPNGDFESIVWRQLSKIKKLYADRPIWFIPHGEDRNEVIPKFCSLLGIEYHRLPYGVEYYMVQQNINPEIVCGFGSSALATLRILYPESEIINWNVVNERAYATRNQAVYNHCLEQIGIKRENIIYHRYSFSYKWKSFLLQVKYFLFHPQLIRYIKL